MKARCAECGVEYEQTDFVVCSDCLTKIDKRNKALKKKLIGHIPYVN